ncbi:uncharacterized protein KZ484_024998 isoform 1-T1 [Pholidichthys leucotaenia]
MNAHRRLIKGVLSSSLDLTKGSTKEITVRPGENITLYCDCKASTGAYIVWYRNCSHDNQPSLVLKTHPNSCADGYKDSNYYPTLNPFPRFHLVNNESSQSYDLQITNISDSDEGFYYCGTQKNKVTDKPHTSICVYTYGNITRILFKASDPHEPDISQDCHPCWILLYSLCPASALLSFLLGSLFICFFQKMVKEPKADEKTYSISSQTRGDQDEDVCYAALEIRPASRKPRKKKAENSDFSIYSAINTCNL